MTRSELEILTRPVAKDLSTFDKLMTQSLKTDSPLINAVVGHLMKSRGKRLRPVVLFLSARGGGFYSPKLIDVALAIELMHTATLLHDDVIDESDIRRGQDTVNHRWDNLISVLMGDFLFSRCFQMLAVPESHELIKAMSHATQRVSYGELRQIEEAANYDLIEKEYIQIIADKTASLFSIACEAGPILKKTSPGEKTRFRNFGENLGIAFQITDDLLDFIGDSKKTGKEPGSDLLQGKVTLPLIYSLAQVSRKSRREITHVLDNGFNRRGVGRILKFVTDQGGIEYTYQAARKYSDRAGELLENLRDTEYSRSMKEIIRFTVTRDN